MDDLDCETKARCATCHHLVDGGCQLKAWLALAVEAPQRPTRPALLAPFDDRPRVHAGIHAPSPAQWHGLAEA